MVIIVSTILLLNRILSSLSQLAREITMQTPCHALYVYQSNSLLSYLLMLYNPILLLNLLN